MLKHRGVFNVTKDDEKYTNLISFLNENQLIRTISYDNNRIKLYCKNGIFIIFEDKYINDIENPILDNLEYEKI